MLNFARKISCVEKVKRGKMEAEITRLIPRSCFQSDRADFIDFSSRPPKRMRKVSNKKRCV